MDPDHTHVVVLMGGWSPEREVSLNSGRACAQALARAGYRDVSEVDVGRDVVHVLEKLRPHVAFNALHGKWGEDGCIQAILETLRIPYTHSGVLASALAMNKELSKAVFRAARIPVPEGRVVALDEVAAHHPMRPPYVVKPVDQGSSVGVYIVRDGANAPASEVLQQREIFGERAMVERYVAGRELTCAVMGGVALGVIDIVPATQFYDYTAKYAPGGSRHILPARVPEGIYRQVQQYALAAHNALGCRGVSRADFRYDDSPSGDGFLALLEVNTQPGMTGTSLVPEIAAHAGHSFEQLVSWMVQDATCAR